MHEFNVGDKVIVNPESNFVNLMKNEGLVLDKIYTITKIKVIIGGNSAYFTEANGYGYSDDCFLPFNVSTKEVDYIGITRSFF